MRIPTSAVPLILLLVLSGATPATAAMCTVDDVPAATLLLPYFEVDLSSADCINTLFSVNNASAAPTIAHVTIWSDLSVPVLDFDLYLTGFDVQTVNLRDILLHGRLPVTAPVDSVSPRGAFSAPHDDFGGTCGITAGEPPWYRVPVLDQAVLAHFRTSLTGQPSPITGDCAGLPHADGFARGYVTVDDANRCSLEFPGDPGYFSPGGAGIGSNDNQLWGDYFYVDPQQGYAQGETLVHVEAADGFTGGANAYTFYARFTSDEGFADNREPLATRFASRYLTGGAFDGGTDLLVWRDSARDDLGRFACGDRPDWYPLGTRQVVLFDEEENPVVTEGPPVSGVPEAPAADPFPAEAQRVSLGGDALPVPAGWENGWIYLDLDLEQPVNPFAADARSAQGWVTAVASATGRYSIGLDALQLDSACEPTPASLLD